MYVKDKGKRSKGREAVSLTHKKGRFGKDG
jgi:hypothetical protein